MTNLLHCKEGLFIFLQKQPAKKAAYKCPLKKIQLQILPLLVFLPLYVKALNLAPCSKVIKHHIQIQSF